jgi:hypothetical protein
LLSCIRSLRGPAALPARARTARAVLLTALVATAAAVLAAPAGASLTANGPVNPRTGYPDWYQDGSGLKLQLCLDGLPLCSAAAGDLVAPAGEAFWWRAQGDLTSGTLTAKMAFAQEAAFLDTAPVSFGRIRVTITGARPNTVYSIRHPYGTLSITTDAGGIGKSTTDVGCAAAPCAWNAALGTAIGPFLHWDPTVPPAPAPGYIGDAATPHAVVGSPTGFNGFALSGGGVSLSTNLLTVEGKLAGPPVPDPEIASATDFGTTTKNAPVQRTITVTNMGVPDAAGRSNLAFGPMAIVGAQAAAFKVMGDSCSGRAIPSGQSCAITVQMTPVGLGAYGAGLQIPTNSAAGVKTIGLNGVVGSAAVAGASARSRLAVRSLRTTHRLTRARVLRRGLRLTMRLPQGAEVLKVSVLRVRNGQANRKPVWLGFRLLPSRVGLYRLRLDSRALRRRLTPGLYQVNVTPGLSKRQLGRTTTTRIRITRG